MPTDEYIGRCVNHLLTLGLGKAPVAPEDIAMCRVSWADYLDDISDDDLKAALRAHVRDPERGRWWPTPADVLSRLEPVGPPERTPEQTWDLIFARVCSPGRYLATDGSGLIAFGDILNDQEQAALRSIGGNRAIGATANDFERKALRDRFLRAMAGGSIHQLVRRS